MTPLHNRNRVCGLGWLLWALWVALRVGAAEPAADFDAANKLYEQGKPAEAAQAFEKLARAGQISGPLYFNLGNACFKAGQIGRAIAAYRQAEILAPRDPDVRANLQFARKQVEGPTLTPRRSERWLGTLTVNEWTVLATVGFWVCFVLLAVGEGRPAWQRPLRRYALLGGAFTLVPVVLLLLARKAADAPTAIVVAKEAVVRNGPLEESPSAFTVHDGAELRVLDTKNEWLQVTDGARRLGWLKRDAAVLAGRSEAPLPAR